MEKNQKIYLAKFEVLSETKTGSLVNGFSAAIDAKLLSQLGGNPVFNGISCGQTNNCHSGNCVAGCGVK